MSVEPEIPAMQMGVAIHSVIDFSDIKRGFNVRVTNEIPPRASLIDLTMMVCGQNRDHAGKTFRNIAKEDREIFPNLKFPGPGQKNTPVGTSSECMAYIMQLPGNGAKDFRANHTGVLSLLFAPISVEKEKTSDIPPSRERARSIEPEVPAMQMGVAMHSVIDFSDVKRGFNVRVTNEIPPRASLIDLTMFVCGQTRKYASEKVKNIEKEGSEKFGTFQFTGRGQQETPVGTSSECMAYIMQLPGNGAKDFRVKWSNVLTRVFAGDVTLIPEIEANGVNVNPMNQFCRAEVDAGRLIENTAHVVKKIKLEEDREIYTLECEIEELKRKKQDTVYAAITARDAAMTASTTAVFDRLALMAERYKKLQPAGGDKRVALVLSDYVDNAMLMQMAGTASDGNDTLPMITNGGPITPCTDNTPITISGFLVEQGVCDKDGTLGKALGAKMARRYREEYGEDPAKHQQNVGGAYRPVNSYTKKHEYMFKEELQPLLVQRSAEDDKRARQPTMDAFCRKK